MTVHELNRDQLIELKQHYLTEKYNGNVSYDDLADADELVSDVTIYRVYEGTTFVLDDFVSSSGHSLDEYSLEIGDCLGDRYVIATDLRQIADAIENGYYSGIAAYGTSWSIM